MTEPALAIDLPEIRVEIEAAFTRYERALVDNDIGALESMFWDDPRTIRYGLRENLHGMDAIRAFRRDRSPSGLARDLSRTQITTYGRDLAVTMTLFTRARSPGVIGRQSQTWMRFANGWKVVAAHVSEIPA